MSKEINDGGPAFPSVIPDKWTPDGAPVAEGGFIPGMSKREEFAKAALQGLLSDPELTLPANGVADLAVEYADALIAALQSPK